MWRAVVALSIAASGVLASCEAVCACPPSMTSEVVYGRVEAATGAGIPSAVINYRITIDTLCAFGEFGPNGEILADAQGRFHDVIYSFHAPRVQCLELQAYDPASKTDTVSILLFADFASPDSTGVVLRLP
jgi:hypothetical protein